MNKNCYLYFEDTDEDFPFYNEKNFLKSKKGISLLFSVILFIFLILGPIKFYAFEEQLVLFFIMTIPFLYAVDGKYEILFKKPKFQDITTIITGWLGFETYFMLLQIFMNYINFKRVPGLHIPGLELTLIANLFQIIGEELFRAVLFLILLYIFYKLTNDRKKSIILSLLIVLPTFGLLHINSINSMIQILIIQGFGSIFETYGYLKTKNVVIAVLIHILVNLSSSFTGLLVL